MDLPGPGSGTGSELMERLTRQVLEGTSDDLAELLAGHEPGEGDRV